MIAQQGGPYGGIEISMDGLRQYLAIVAGESSNNIDEAAAIGSVILNRLAYKKAAMKGNFVSKIGGDGQYDAIGGRIYNEIMAFTEADLLHIITNGAYFWNATYQGFKENMGANFKAYCNGVFESTGIIGGSSFFRYYDKTKRWP